MEFIAIEDVIELFGSWDKIQTLAKQITAANAQIIDCTGKVVAGELSSFCRLVQSSKIGELRCRRCYIDNCFTPESLREKSFIFKCHAGLTIFGAPLIYQEAPYLAILCGPVLRDDEEVDRESFVKYAQEIDVDPHDMLTELLLIKKVSLQQIQTFGSTAKTLINSLAETLHRYQRLVSRTEKLISRLKEREQAEKAVTIPAIAKEAEKRRVVITGLGIISPIGTGKDVFWEAIEAGKSGANKITSFDPSPFPTQIAAEVKDFEPTFYISPKDIRRMARSVQFSVACAKMAVEDAGLDLSNVDLERIGVFVGASVSGIEFAEEQYAIFMERGVEKVSPFLMTNLFTGASAAEVSIHLGLKAQSLTLSTGCTAASDAISSGFDAIRNGEVDIAFAGGTDAPVRPVIFSSFCAIGLVSKRNDGKASRPFDLKRDGLVLGEGAAVLILEELQHALNRKAHIYAELIGHGTTSDAYHITRPAPDRIQAARAINIALQDARIKPEDVNYINAHGTATQLNDLTETHIIKDVFGDHAYKIPVSSTKSMIGHCMGAAGALELATCALAIENQFIPPTINYEYPDPDCDLDCVPNKGRSAEIGVVLSNSFGFGGKNTALIIRKFT